jgi:hypothetical protein
MGCQKWEIRIGSTGDPDKGADINFKCPAGLTPLLRCWLWKYRLRLGERRWIRKTRQLYATRDSGS